MKRLPLAILLALGACSTSSYKYRSYPTNPWPDVHRVVIVPFVNMTDQERLDTDEFSQNYANELVKFPGFEVVRPISVRQALKGDLIKSVEQALKLSRELKADSILITHVTDADPYDPPRIGLRQMLLRTDALMMSDAEIDRMIQSASWRQTPLPMTQEHAGNLIFAFEEVWDSHSINVRDEINKYADAQTPDDTAHKDGHEFLAVFSRYEQFVSNQAINRFIRHARYGL